MTEELGERNLNERGAQEQADRSRGDNQGRGLPREPEGKNVPHTPEGRDVPPSDADRDPDSPWMGGG